MKTALRTLGFALALVAGSAVVIDDSRAKAPEPGDAWSGFELKFTQRGDWQNGREGAFDATVRYRLTATRARRDADPRTDLMDLEDSTFRVAYLDVDRYNEFAVPVRLADVLTDPIVLPQWQALLARYDPEVRIEEAPIDPVGDDGANRLVVVRIGDAHSAVQGTLRTRVSDALADRLATTTYEAFERNRFATSPATVQWSVPIVDAYGGFPVSKEVDLVIDGRRTRMVSTLASIREATFEPEDFVLPEGLTREEILKRGPPRPLPKRP